MLRYNSYLLLILTTTLLSACGKHNDAPDFDQAELLPGDGMTSRNISRRSYVEPGENTTTQDQLLFWTGFSLFRDPWVVAPSSTKDRDGLGPVFNSRSCISCHQDGARTSVIDSNALKPSGLVIRLGSTDSESRHIDANYGGQIQTKSLSRQNAALKPEARVEISYQTLSGQYADGEHYELIKPLYALSELAYGNLRADIGLSPRFAPIVYGAGLLDAIDTKDLLSQEDTDDKDNDGISAKYNRVINVTTQQKQVGRFGHKAKHPNLLQQVASAFRDDIGITNTLFPEESCTKTQTSCQKIVALGGHTAPEIPDKLLNLVNQFNQSLAVPPARNLGDKNKQKGRKLFYKLGCESCHTAYYQTSQTYPVDSLSNQSIWPYTDLALHDMGPDLADGVYESEATGNEWRTPPLWGIGLQQQFRAEQRYLHDGRARSITEAILWHGGEATQSQQQFIQLEKGERQQLIAFLEAI